MVSMSNSDASNYSSTRSTSSSRQNDGNSTTNTNTADRCSSSSSSNCVISDVIELYCHNIVLNSKGRTTNSHRLHYFLKLFGRDAITSNSRILCSAELVGILLKITHLRTDDDDDNNNDDDGDDDDDNNDNDNESNTMRNSNDETVEVPLDAYSPKDWEILLTELVGLRDRFITIGSTSSTQSCSRSSIRSRREYFSMWKGDWTLHPGDGGGNGRDVRNMTMFHKLFDDVTNFGYFLQALSYVRPFHNDEKLYLLWLKNKEIDTIINKLPDHSKYKDMLQNIRTTNELLTILNKRTTDGSIHRFRRTVETLLQNWYMTCIPIPYLVRLKYPHAVQSLEEGVLERNTTDIDSDNDIEDTNNNNNNNSNTTTNNSNHSDERSATGNDSNNDYGNDHNQSEEQQENLMASETLLLLSGREKDNQSSTSTTINTTTTTTHRIEPKEFNTDRWGENKAHSPRCKKPIVGKLPTKNKQSLSFSSDDDDGDRPSLSEIPIKVDIQPKKKRIRVSSPSKGRKRFTQEEKHAIIHGAEKFGVGKWKEIKDYYNELLGDRTSIQIKDCYRTMVNKCEL